MVLLNWDGSIVSRQKPARDKYDMPPWVFVTFAAGVFALPFDYFFGIPIFGEFSFMASFYVFFPLLLIISPLLVLHRAPAQISPELKWFYILITIAIAASLIANIGDVVNAELKGRPGWHKATMTTIALYFCMSLSYLSAWLASNRNFISHFVVKPTIMVLLFVVLPVAMIEISTWFIPAMNSVFKFVSGFLRNSSLGGREFGNFGRLRSMCGEPSFFALYMGFAFIWCYYLWKKTTQNKWLNFLLLMMVMVFYILSGARTAYLIFLGFLLIWFFRPVILLKNPPETIRPFSFGLTFVFLLLFAALVFLLHNDELAQTIVHGNNVSNLSRYSSNYTAMELFMQKPIIGNGWGQYAFQAFDELPDWAWNSWEIRGWFTNPLEQWPAVFSTPARVAAELGIFGVIAWYLPILHLFRKLIFVVRKEKMRIGKLPPLGSALLFGMGYVLLYGVAQESFRQMGAWIILGIVSTYTVIENPESHYTKDTRTISPKEKFSFLS